jgi:hypothetical protein
MNEPEATRTPGTHPEGSLPVLNPTANEKPSPPDSRPHRLHSSVQNTLPMNMTTEAAGWSPFNSARWTVEREPRRPGMLLKPPEPPLRLRVSRVVTEPKPSHRVDNLGQAATEWRAGLNRWYRSDFSFRSHL